MCSTWTAFLGSLNIWGKIRKKEICYHDVARRGWNTSISLVRWWWLLLYSTILCSRADSLRLHVILHSAAFYSVFLNIHQSGVLTVLALLVPHETAAILAQVLCTTYNHAPCHCMQSHIHKVYACLAVTCHLHFWQNDRDLLHATTMHHVTSGKTTYVRCIRV